MIVPKKAASQPSAPRSPDFLSLGSTAGWPLDSAGDGALKVTAVYRAIKFSSETLSIMPFFVFDRNTRGHIKGHPLIDLLQMRPNEMMTPSEYKARMEINRLLDGNAYSYIVREPHTGRPSELLPLPPKTVQPVLDAERQLHYLFSDPISGNGYDLAPCQIIHYKAFCRGQLQGISPLAYAREVIEKDRTAKAYERALYRNGGRPSGVLYTDSNLSGYSEEYDNDGTLLSRKEVVRRAWEKVHSGGDNAFRTAVLDMGLKYQPIAMNNTDAQFVESNDITVADIARIFGVPLHVLMSGKQSYESNMQNRIEYVQTTAQAALVACEEEDSYKLLSTSDLQRGLWIRRNMDAALRGDTKSRSEYYKTMHQIGAYSVNDIEALEDRPDVPGGDVHQASLNYIPLEDFRDLSRKRNDKEAK